MYYIASLRGIGRGPKTLLCAIVEAMLYGRGFSPDHRALAKTLKTSPRTVKRWTRALRDAQYIRVDRRSRRSTNAYMLTRRFWSRVIVGNKPLMPDWLRAVRQRHGLTPGRRA